MRAAGNDDRGRSASAYRGYWVRSSSLLPLYAKLSQFEGWLTDQELSAQAEWRYRALTAVCLNWNDFSEFAELQLPRGESLTCLIGPAAPQPVRSTLSILAPTTPILRGGMEQIFFRGGDANPLWVRIRPKSAVF